MSDIFDFDPDLSLEEETEKAEVIPYKPTTVVQNSDKSVTLNHMVDMTKQHIEDDARVRDEINELTGILDDSMHQMSIKELLEYLKIKIKEREFHVKAIFDAYNFVQKTEIAREMLVGADRRERVNQTVNSKRLTKIMGYLNLNNRIKTED